MNCPVCHRQLGCSCQIKKDNNGAVIGCSTCLQGRTPQEAAVIHKSPPPPIPRTPAGAPVVNRAYWTRSKQPQQ